MSHMAQWPLGFLSSLHVLLCYLGDIHIDIMLKLHNVQIQINLHVSLTELF